tara:strand:+ start:419 stop:616 length:198 start_codon:yes stop_codon:yes gene_type:complete
MTQNEQILKHLQSGKTLSPLDALKKFGCMRLGARVYNLKQEGHDIETSFKTQNGKTFAIYKLKNH